MFSHNISTMVGTQLHTSDVTTMACQLQEAGKRQARAHQGATTYLVMHAYFQMFMRKLVHSHLHSDAITT